jgi:hypothetical protein
MFFWKNHGEGGSGFVQLRPQLEPLDNNEGFLASLSFKQREILDQLGIEVGNFD